MSRSLGLREDQREGEVLATLIFGLFPERSKDRSLRQLLQESALGVGAAEGCDLLRPAWPTRDQTLGIVANIEAR
ncbi:hypothetical protein FX983_04122 [Pseudomonas frederiksbergensis]|uniref:Uncharacterized protein n=1 Tax=Pseudomonas frederiksbergensis TaxID=104087 RepID=A0A6L5BN06_9PSED|nr:hypothetical protein FX983_04122 [Pseudomonas frederiksbergensis]